jgi:uncharacterized protein involved in outer membrane biogenesis
MTGTRSRKRFVIAGAVGLLALLVSLGFLFIDVGRNKPRLESAASKALGMEVRFDGRMYVGLLPVPHLSVGDGRVLGARGEVVASAKKLRLWVELLPLLGGYFRLRRLELVEPRLSMERGDKGALNVAGLKHALALLGELDGASVSIRDGALTYAGGKSGSALEATHVDISVDRLRYTPRTDTLALKGLSFRARIDCGGLRAGTFNASAIHFSVVEDSGVFEVAPLTLHVFGGEATGSVRADYSGPVPAYLLRGSLPAFRIEQFVRSMSLKPSGQGQMNFTTNVTMRGWGRDGLMRSLSGEMSLQGHDLVLVGSDVDRRLGRYNASQNFSLVDVGGVFFAGPLSLALTRGFKSANVFGGGGGSTPIGTLVSNWKVDRGVAIARDVAMTTAQHRIALQGGLDLAGARFVDVTVAVVDAKGCAVLKQEIHGSFEKPQIEKPHALPSIAGPVVSLLKRARGVFPKKSCEPFYSGTVAPPR